MTRHARIPPTRELFKSPTTGTEVTVKGDHAGYLINAQAEYCNTELRIPWDYHGLVELVVALIPAVKADESSTMTFSVELQYGKKDQIFSSNNVTNAAGDPAQFGFTGPINIIKEINISNLVRSTGFAVRDLEAGDYLGIDVLSDTNNGDDLNAFILGILLRYKVFKGK